MAASLAGHDEECRFYAKNQRSGKWTVKKQRVGCTWTKVVEIGRRRYFGGNL